MGLTGLNRLRFSCQKISSKNKTSQHQFHSHKYEGPSYEKIQQTRAAHFPPAVYTIYRKPLLLHEGRMQWLFDHTGKKYLDLFGGIVTVSVGHCHPKMVRAVTKQLNTLWHTTNIYYHPAIHEYAEKLASKFPGNLKVVYLVNSGTEASDLAMVLARAYTGNQDVVTLRGSYHGYSSSMMALTATQTYRLPMPVPGAVHHFKHLYEAYKTIAQLRISPPNFTSVKKYTVYHARKCLREESIGKYTFTFGLLMGRRDFRCSFLVGSFKAMLPDPYRGIWGGCRDSISQVKGSCSCVEECVTSDKYIGELNEILLHSIPSGKAAAFFAESIQGVGGCLQFTKGYLKKAVDLIHKNGGLFVADEVQTGFGRTGDHFWGFEAHGVVPDIVTMAKGIGNGFPLGAVVTTPEIAAAHTKATYFNTFGGNALACAAGKSVLEILEEEDLQSNSKNVGLYLMQQLMDLQRNHEIIGDVRGKGLMVGVELVKPGTKDPLNILQVLDVCEMAKEEGILVGRGGRYGNVLRIKPPMCITKTDVDFAVKVLDKCFKYSFERK